MTSLTEQHYQSVYDQLSEELHEKWNKEGYQKGLEQGRKLAIDSAVEYVIALISRYGGSVDEAISTLGIQEAIAPEVKRQAEARLCGTSR